MNYIGIFAVVLATLQFVVAQPSNETVIKPVFYIQELQAEISDNMKELIRDVENDFVEANGFFLRHRLAPFTVGFSQFLDNVDELATPDIISNRLDVAYESYRDTVTALFFKGKDAIDVSLCPMKTTSDLNAYSIELEKEVKDVVESLRKKYRAEVQQERTSLGRSFRAIQNKVNSCTGIEISKSTSCLNHIIEEDGPKANNLAKNIMRYFPTLFDTYFADLKQFLDEIAANSTAGFDDALNSPCFP